VNESDLDAEDFLELLWGEDEGWIELPAKVNGYWVPWQLFWPPSQDTIVSNRIDQCLHDEEDLYYSVAMFREKGRNIEHVMPTGWLWADLDEVHPSTAVDMGIMPTVAIESSPGRYQALWRLTRKLKTKDTERLNRGLTYALGADKGGWDLTQVLRIPGTRNFKYPGGPRVRMLWYNELVYEPRDVWAMVKEHVPAAELVAATDIVLPKRDIPHRARRLLAARPEETVDGERSDKLFELNCLLAEAGCEDEEIYDLVVNSAWNKFAGRGSSSRTQLMRDIRRAVTHVKKKVRAKKVEQAVKADGSDQPLLVGWEKAGKLPRVSIKTLVNMEIKEPDWLVEDIWTAGGRGILGGEPKTSKTLLAMAMGMAVASGQPFLGEFEVIDSGPVLMIQNENRVKMMQDRARGLMAKMGISKDEETPMWTVDNVGFDLDYDRHLEILEADINDLRPKLVIFDPLINMVGDVDSDKSSAIQPILNELIRMGVSYKCAILIVHHAAKRSQNTPGRRAGQRLLGSTALHAFNESMLFASHLDDHRDGWSALTIDREFRSFEPQTPIRMAWHLSTTGMDIELTSQNKEGLLVETVREEGPLTIKQLVEKADSLQLERKAILRLVDKSPVLKRTHGRGRIVWIEYIGNNGASPTRVNGQALR